MRHASTIEASKTTALETISPKSAVRVHSDVKLVVENLSENQPAELMMLQGRPIGEPVVQQGPFGAFCFVSLTSVMNTHAEIHDKNAEYSRTQFGGWPYPTSAPVHGREKDRFAIHPSGRYDSPPTSTKALKSS